MPKRKKIAFVGAGNVGATCAHLCFLRSLGDIVLYDIIEGLPEGKALDMLESAPVLGIDVNVTGSTRIRDIAGADCIVVTSGSPRKPGMSRDDLLKINAGVMNSVGTAIKKVAPQAFVIVVTNPLDAMVTQIKRVTGFPKHQVAGQAGVLDSARYRTFLAMELGVSVDSVKAMVLGGHGDDMVPVRSYTTCGGVPIEKPIGAPRLEAIEKRTRDGGAEIVNLMKTSSYYAAGTAVYRMVESYMLDKKEVLPAAAYLEGEYGVRGLYAGVPVVVGGGGVEKIIEIDLTAAEKQAFESSVGHVRELVEAMDKVLSGMNIHEFQAKQILSRFGAPVPKGQPATTPEETAQAFTALGLPKAVVKVQIHAGGRGKAGGVKLLSSANEARDFAAKLLGTPLVTHQTGPEGRVVRRMYVEQASEIARELYIGLVVDRKAEAISVIASTEGGMEIEEIAAKTPERIITETIDPIIGLGGFQSRKIAFALGLKDKQVGKFNLLAALYKAFNETDASLIEINPLVVTKDGSVICLDAKMSFDDNALFRHPEIREMRDSNEEDPAEAEASKFDLSYVHLDGNIGCMVNGAGLAMATMDIVKYFGAEPANFLDVGGGANSQKVAAAFRILLADERVKAVLINIFGGIMQCDVLAQGVVDAAREVKLSIPLIVRMEGTNVDKGKQILKDSGIAVIAASDMSDAAKRAVEAIK